MIRRDHEKVHYGVRRCYICALGLSLVRDTGHCYLTL